MKNPKAWIVKTSRGDRYIIQSTGKDGTKITRFISKEDYESNFGKGKRSSPKVTRKSSPKVTRKSSPKRTVAKKTSTRRVTKKEYCGC